MISYLFILVVTFVHFYYSELVIILKPRNLQKVHPTIHALPSTMTSPLLATVSCPKLDDPGHMLRESLTALKGSLSSGKGQLHFDVSVQTSLW